MQAEPTARSKWYREAWTVGGVVLRWGGVTREGKAMGTLVEMDGKACERLGLQRVAEVAAITGLRCSRIDVAWDGCGFTPAVLWRDWQRDRVRTVVKLMPGRRYRQCHWHQEQGDTLYMGGKASERRACVYDRRGPTRYEMRWRGAAAAVVGADLFRDVGDGWARRAMGHVRAFVDYVEPGTGRLLPYWAEFVGDAARAEVSLRGRPDGGHAAAVAWLEKSVARTLALVVAVEGEGYLQRLLAHGRAQFTAADHRVAGGVFTPAASAFPVDAGMTAAAWAVLDGAMPGWRDRGIRR